MVKAGYLDHAEYSQYSAEPLTLNFHRTDHKDGSATYLREYLRKYLMATRPERKDDASWNYAQFVTDSILWNTDPLYGWCTKNFKKDGSPYNVYSDGLKVFTTVDSRMQRYAEEAVFSMVQIARLLHLREHHVSSVAGTLRIAHRVEERRILAETDERSRLGEGKSEPQ